MHSAVREARFFRAAVLSALIGLLAGVAFADHMNIHVLDGSATLVTGGAVVDGRRTEPDEIRGASVRAGESRRIAKGDVIIVPNGVPHWFQEVPGPLTYYVVKVR